MISLNGLRTFLEVVRCGSVREASEALVISQPAVSAALAALQHDIGAPLVAREGRGIVITAAGRSLALYGRRIFALIEEGTAVCRQASANAAGRLRLAAVTTAAEHLAPDLLQRFREHEPTLEVELEVGNHAQLWDRLAHWEVDLVLAGRPPQGRLFQSVATRAHQLIVIGRPGRRVDPSSLDSHTWLVREPGSGTRAATEGLFALLGIDPPRLTIGSNGAIQACVRAGLGISLASGDAVGGEIRAGSLVAIATPSTPLARSWHLVTTGGRDVPEAAARFIAFLTASASFVEAPKSDARE